jgi:DNA invertase Pin-like site-specific DNA recombinase
VSYVRVSTRKQGASGLGLEAQRHAVETFAASRRAKIIGSFVEVESGKANARPELQKALHLAKVTGATLAIAKLDRLSRNAAFLLTLRDSGARFVAVDLPDANSLSIGILAVVAEQEREAISKRTKEALAAAKARGVRLGNPNGAAALRRAGRGNAAGLRAIRLKADEHARSLAPVIAELAAEGKRSFTAIAAALNEREILAPRGGRWHDSSARNLLARLAKN